MLPAGSPTPGPSPGLTLWANHATARPGHRRQETGPNRKQPQEATHPTLTWSPTQLTPQGNMPTTSAGSAVLPEVCLGVCSQLPHSGIWTPLYNLPKEEATQSPHRQQPEPQQNYAGEETWSSALPSSFQTAAGTSRRHRSLVRLLHIHVTATCATWGTHAVCTETRGAWGSNRSMINMGSLTLGAPKASDTSILQRQPSQPEGREGQHQLP